MEKMPNSVCWNITSRCNDKCQFCYREKNSKELSFMEQKKVIDRIAASGIQKLTFAGGEPLLLSGLEELVLYAKRKGLIVSMTSNCILMTPERLQFYFENLDWLTLSLDGADAGVQTKMTRNSGHADRMINILREASRKADRKCRIKINTVVSQINKENIEEIADIVMKYPVARWKLFQFTPIRGNAKETKEKFEISENDFMEIAERMRAKLEGGKTIFSISDSNNIENAYFVIFPNGDIRISSDGEDHFLGNILSRNIQEIWATGGYRKELHEMRTGFILKNKEMAG